MAKKLDYHAKLVIHGLPTMKSVTQSRLVQWLEKQVKDMKKAKVGEYSKLFTARLMK